MGSRARSLYPDYKSLITEYDDSTSVSGDFTPQSDGWVGMESGKDPRSGYFEFEDGVFTQKESPDQRETDRLLDELRSYHQDQKLAYEQAEKNAETDFTRLGQLLREHLYTWWD